ncbi:MAG TPA: Hpt domain-containing protein [Telluria sp.]|nr:Hpt domain-containing protein [Telluria sp.]
MTNYSYAAPFDTGPLSWVIGEIRDALGRSAEALGNAVGAAADVRATQLQHAKTHLHQAHGALQMVDVAGATAMTESAEHAIDQFRASTAPLLSDQSNVVREAYAALIEYLDELLAGAAPQPVRLFPYYRALLELQRAERIHPSDLFAGELPAAALPAAEPSAPPDYAAYRARFEKALLPYLRAPDAAARAAHAAELRDAVALVAAAQQEPQARTFWAAMEAFADLVASGQLDGSVYVKQLFGQVNLQMRRLVQGEPDLPAQVLRDALFFIAGATDPTPRARELRALFGIEGLVPADYERKRYGRFDAAALAAARDALAQAESAWSALSTDAAASEPQEQRFGAALETLEQAIGALGIAPLAQLAGELRRAASDSRHLGRSEHFGLEMASAMLFIGHALDQVRQLPPEFPDHAEAMGARLLALAAGETPPAAPAWQGALGAQGEQDQTVHVLAEEMKTGLRQAEKVLDDYYADPSRREALAEIDPVLHQLQGALAILDQEDAMRAAQHVKEAVRALAAGRDPEQASESLVNIAQNVGALGFFIDTLAHQPDQARDRFEFDQVKGLFASVPFGRGKASATAPEAAAPAAPAPAPAPVTELAAPAPVQLSAPPAIVAQDEVEAELLEIFIMEAQEVLETVGETLPAAHADPSSQETLTRLRRAFHTLKGSGRMVGLNQLGDAAHAIEKVMNHWLSESRPASPDLLALLGRAQREMTLWVDELASTGTSARVADMLVADAALVQAGEPLPPEQEAEAPAPLAEVIELAPPPAEEEDDSAQLAGEAPSAEVIEFPVAAAPQAAPRDEAMRRVGSLEIAVPLFNIYLAETDELMQVLDRDFAAWRDDPSRAVSPEALKASHTLTGTSATVGFAALREVAYALEMALQVMVPPAPPVLQEQQRELLDSALATVRQMLDGFAAGELAEPRPDLVADLQALREQLSRQGGEEQAAVEAEELDAYAGLVQPVAAPGDAEVLMAEAFDAEFADQFDMPELDQVDDALAAPMAGELPLEVPAAGDEDLSLPSPREDADEFTLEIAPVAEDSRHADAFALASSPATDSEDLVEDTLEFPLPAAHEEAEAFSLEAVPQPADEQRVEEFALGASPASDAEELMEQELPPSIGLDLEPPGEAADAAPLAMPMTGSIVDDLDPDLLPVFVEEATDMLPEIGNALRSWQADPSDGAPAKALLRYLHTVKGSARMAGAMRLGQHTHDIETQIENMVHAGTTTPAAFDELMANYDQALLMFEQLQQGEAPQAPAPSAPQAAGGAVESAPVQVQAEAQVVHARTPLVRVRADILDRLVNQAGEVSIARSKLETQIGTAKASLQDLSENLARLSAQLREVEMQAESQIASRMSIAGERGFDPLEFDRFTRLQELTRMMAESVNDVSSFHESLTRSVDGATADLAVQSRLTRDLQQDLMRVRMVPFASLSERLYRVARGAAKELDKRVNLDIRGGTVEIDRSVLEQMAAPFEHLLRNAIVHGVEPRDVRVAAGKPETGELLVQVSQQGNEVVLQFSDDGAGLDLQRIRERARRNGLIAEGQELSDAQAADLIFEPGFTTADALTELAGRGVGMDVVRAEAEALGGRVSIETTSGKGARFTIHLPLTLAVTQVVPVTGADRTYALPAILVEQVLYVKAAALAEAQSMGAIDFKGARVPLHYLPALLGEDAPLPPPQRSTAVLVLHSGAERIALQVDEVQGNREVVIKNIGPQLARVAGIAGATVLGTGEIVLILNPVSLAHHLGQHPELQRSVPAGALAVPEVPRHATVMVVDDSLTVRRVTQRLLEREGYTVLLAKDGVDALSQVQETRPDLMLVDIEMPRMDGFDLTRNIRGAESTRGIPIIMITSRTADKHRNYAFELGVDAYFGKPFQEAVLVEAIGDLLRKKA